ncbi:hypothetical protein JL720_840 [Aureococcus anophagefferens]|nr:hypothetical protein JL720_840 [Aureococcus anophagefferens]
MMDMRKPRLRRAAAALDRLSAAEPDDVSDRLSVLDSWFESQTFNDAPSARTAVAEALVRGLDHDDLRSRLIIARETLRLLDGTVLAGDGREAATSSRRRRGRRTAQQRRARALEPLIYAAGTIKNLTNHDGHLRPLGQLGIICTLCDLLRAAVAHHRHEEKRTVDDASEKRRFDTRKKQVAQLLVQVSGALRNMCAEKSQLRQLGAARAATALAACLRPFGTRYWELTLNVARALAKLSLHEPTRTALHGDPKRLGDVLATLEAAHEGALALGGTAEPSDALAPMPAVVLRLAFALGNLTASNDANRSGAAFLAGGGGDDAEQVLIKLIRLVANMSINPDVGVLVANAPGVRSLTRLLRVALDRSREELVLNIVSAITNLSYYVTHRPPRAYGFKEDESLFADHGATCGGLLDALLHDNSEAVSETARAFGNFSRDAAARRIMRDVGADEALVLLLVHTSRDVAFAAAGALVNVAADPATKGILLRDDLGGTRELVEIVRRAGLQDLALAAVACKALHNLLLEAEVGGAAALLGARVHGRLRDTLAELVDAAEDAATIAAETPGAEPDAGCTDFLAAARAPAHPRRGLSGGEAIKAKEQVAASFVRVVVPDGKSIFESKVGRRDMLIVEKGELRMVSCHGEKHKKDRPLIKMVAQGEMMGMMELVRNEVYLKNLLTNTGDKAAKLFCDNLEALTRASVVDWLRKVKVLSGLDDECMNKFANVAHFKSEFEDKLVVAQDAKLSKLHVVLSGALRVHCHDSRGDEITVGHLQSGDFFGESSLLNKDDKDHGFLPLGSTASVTTESECLFIYFDADKMREVIETMPSVTRQIDEYIKERITAQLLAMNLTLFDAMRPAAIALFTSVFEIHTYGPGDVIVKEGQAGDFFYVLVNGAVKIDSETGIHVELNTKGDYFGGDEPPAVGPLCLESPEMAAEFEIKALGTKAGVGALLAHPRTRPLLTKTLDDEFSSENYHCWDLAEQYKAAFDTAPGADALNVLADAIYKRFIVTDTEELINMSAKATKGLKKHFDEPPPGGPPRDLWDGLQKCISNNLRGNLQRFC